MLMLCFSCGQEWLNSQTQSSIHLFLVTWYYICIYHYHRGWALPLLYPRGAGKYKAPLHLPATCNRTVSQIVFCELFIPTLKSRNFKQIAWTILLNKKEKHSSWSAPGYHNHLLHFIQYKLSQFLSKYFVQLMDTRKGNSPTILKWYISSMDAHVKSMS